MKKKQLLGLPARPKITNNAPNDYKFWGLPARLSKAFSSIPTQEQNLQVVTKQKGGKHQLQLFNRWNASSLKSVEGV